MKLIYRNDHVSITKFTDVELPDFVVLTGVNGSGKTHLLRAIENKNVVIEGLEDERAVFFDYKSFFLDNESVIDAQQIVSDKNGAWQFFNQNVKQQVLARKNNLGAHYDLLKKIAEELSKPLLSLTKEDISEEGVFQQYATYRDEIKKMFSKNDALSRDDRAKGIMALMEEIKFSIDEITEMDFFHRYKPFQLKSEFLPMQLGKVIWDYYLEWDDNRYNRYLNTQEAASVRTLSDSDFFKLYGEKPWIVMAKILANFRGLSYTVNSPEEPKLKRTDSFQLQLLHSQKGFPVTFDNLSSGEKVLMALVASIYKISSDNHFPKVLLLDEIDASLHPSMIGNLLEVIKEVFLLKGTKVILVTHSPSTIALADEANVFAMDKNGTDLVKKVSRSEALELLTQGFATLDQGIRLFDQISRRGLSIITEGKNTELIARAAEFFAKDILGEFEIITGLESIAGWTHVKTIHDFFSRVTHQNKVLCVFDCDVTTKLEDKNDTYSYILPQNSGNRKVTRGIENLFPEALFTDEFYVTQGKEDGGSHKTLDKKKFLTHIVKNGVEADFTNFKLLFEEVRKLISVKSAQGVQPSSDSNPIQA